MGNHHVKEGITHGELDSNHAPVCPKRSLKKHKKYITGRADEEGDASPMEVDKKEAEPPTRSSRSSSLGSECSVRDIDSMTQLCGYGHVSIDFEIWIPDEVWSHIFSFLPLADIARVGTVSIKFHRCTEDVLLWKALCENRLNVTTKLESLSWKEYYKLLTCITWDPENCVPNEFKFYDNNKTIAKTTSYGVATARSKCVFGPNGGKYCFEIKVNYRRPNFFYGIGFIDKSINFNFCKSSYPKSTEAGADEKRYESQWFYWSDGNCWDILGSHPVSAKTRKFIGRKDPQPGDANGQQQSLAFHSGDTIGVVLDYTSPENLLTFFLNGSKAHQFALPKPMELYLAVYFYNANDSVTIQHCDPRKYEALV